MTDNPRATLGMVLTELGAEARVLVGTSDDLNRPVTGASVVTDLEPPSDPGVVLICPSMASAEELAALFARLSSSVPRILLSTTSSLNSSATLADAAARHIVVDPGATMDPAAAVLAVA